MGYLSVAVHGIVRNFVPSSAQKHALQRWKVQVATAVKAERGGEPWSSEDDYVVMLEYGFHLPSHWNQHLDVENYVKPVLDGLAAGLFCSTDRELADIRIWNYPDHNFRTLLIHRLPHVQSEYEESVDISVWNRQSWNQQSVVSTLVGWMDAED
ncbi:MAG: RusA family crossover junction endodeoxyribonuclease [Chloroflexi bacterium]|nr:RusA family crossover junction endodeoxyribonuclease [Chloroflexota bacterium]MYF64621.1 RusA family crossover junction endodeoxyribonuclease [Chloroflexota bacterium]MYK35209.1 RusA family crossover junction endodeoxyribonuclease [Chloroflexota bacterium]